MAVIDDKSEHCIPFLLEQLERHRKEHGDDAEPFFLGLNGVQGAGKSTLVGALQETLTSPPHNLGIAVISLDDFYLRHEDQVALARSHPSNPLVQHRGQPGTHDLPLLARTLVHLREGLETGLPRYDKSLFAGAGDRAPESTWTIVNSGDERSVDVVILEGWCTGFTALSPSALSTKHQAAQILHSQPEGKNSQLGRLKLRDVELVNDALREYDEFWKYYFDAFVHIDAADTLWVYDWRLEAEVKMRELKGTENAMTDEQVKEFVDGYYPAYELYTDDLRKGLFPDKGRQLRLVVGKDRRVVKVERI